LDTLLHFINHPLDPSEFVFDLVESPVADPDVSILFPTHL